ncbi:transcription termination factor Rho [Candidatus Gottesmanbacteria bacterium]|nr:transcription termination factor Rho [Candidatus Gottesmanbacteria bacterium]
MAFRASRKTVQPKDQPSIPTQSPLSVEDLVGAPVGKPEEKKAEAPRESFDSAQDKDSGQAPRESSGQAPRPASAGSGSQGAPRPHFEPRSFVRHSPGFGGAQDKPRFSPGFHRSGGPRPAGRFEQRFERFSGGYKGRDYSNNGNGFTQDIDVPTETVRGMLDIMPEGHGFLRPKFTPSDGDVYISLSQIRRFLLRNGDVVEGQARQPKDNERYWGLLKVQKVNDLPAEEMQKRPRFEDLTPVYPNKQLKLETGTLPLSTRMIDLVAPIGFGQRGLIVSPPKAGKTTILKELAAGIAANYPQVHLMAALIGERPEEVTDISRSVKGEVLSSNFDESPQEQTRIAEVALDRAKRLVEMGRDVVILLDSITRLARAYNLVVNPSGRTLSGGFDPAALYPAKRFLGAARCVEGVEKLASGSLMLDKDVRNEKLENQTSNIQLQHPTSNIQHPTSHRVTSGGSLTVIGTTLIDTGSRMDDLIYEEFKGTGNMELTLSRVLQERRVFPAIDVAKSGTRHDELLLGEEAMKKVTTLRHMLSMLSDEERTMMLIDRLGKTKTNAEFLDSLAKG